MLKCPKCGSVNIIPDRLSETGQRCLMCGTEPTKTNLPVISGRPEKEEEKAVSRGHDYPCKRLGCTKGGFFHRYCKRHFPEAYGMSWEDYLKNRAFKGEKPHLVAARIKTGLDTSNQPGKVCSEETAPGIAATAVILPQDLWDRLSEIAETESRTLVQQVLHILRCALEAHQPVMKMTVEIPDRSLKECMVHLIKSDPEVRAAIKG